MHQNVGANLRYPYDLRSMTDAETDADTDAETDDDADLMQTRCRRDADVMTDGDADGVQMMQL